MASKKHYISCTQSTGPWVLLQCLASPFPARLSRKMRAQGIPVCRVNFCGGDWLFRGPEEQIYYRGPLEQLEEFYENLARERDIKGFILFGDMRAVHQPAIRVAQRLGIYALVLEEGYIRPGWLTLELFGTNANSPLPKTMTEVQNLWDAGWDSHTPANIRGGFARRAISEVANLLAMALARPFFPHYRWHRPYPLAREAWYWIKFMLSQSKRKRLGRKTMKALQNPEAPPYFLVPLQLSQDMQIRKHAPQGGIAAFLETVMASFAVHAPKNSQLLFKEHPMDNGIVDFRTTVQNLGAKYGVSARIVYIQGGDIDTMIRRSVGVVLLNSTVGLAALQHGRPVLALARAIYNMPGLTHQDGIDSFWDDAIPADEKTVRKFMELVTSASLIEGDLFTDSGMDLAADALVDIVSGKRPRLISHSE